MHAVSGRGTVRAAARTAFATFSIDNRRFTYVDAKAQLRFRSSRVTALAFGRHSATLRGVGVRNGKRVSFRVVATDGRPDAIHVAIGRYARNGILVRGFLTVR